MSLKIWGPQKIHVHMDKIQHHSWFTTVFAGFTGAGFKSIHCVKLIHPLLVSNEEIKESQEEAPGFGLSHPRLEMDWTNRRKHLDTDMEL